VNLIQAFLRQKQILSIRRNHSVEHATIHILSKQHPSIPISGYSDARGFWILAHIPLEDIQLAVDEAVARLKAGESRLAYHPNCGTNFVTSGIMAGLAAWVGMIGVGKKFSEKVERLPVVFTLSTLALIAAQPVAYNLQVNGSTTSDLGNYAVLQIEDVSRGAVQAFRIHTHSG